VLLLHFRCCVFAVVFQIGSELFRLPLGLVLVKTSVVMAGSPKEKSFTTQSLRCPRLSERRLRIYRGGKVAFCFGCRRLQREFNDRWL
jgi:hypothetical protein